MDYPPSDLIDKLSILKLKVERIGEPHLTKDLEACQKALERCAHKGIVIKHQWIDGLYALNKKIWYLDFEIRELVHSNRTELTHEEYEHVGKNSLAILELMKQRVAIKNEIVRETGLGFTEIKVDHASA